MGNAIVAKPSELTPTTASMLADVLTRAGLPDGIFNVVHGSGADAGAALCAHPDVGAVSFTGGTATGAAVAAAVAPRFAKLSLELGGKNPLIVYADCDFDVTVDGAVRAAFLNSGQVSALHTLLGMGLLYPSPTLSGPLRPSPTFSDPPRPSTTF